MARYLSAKQKAIWQFSPDLSAEDNIKIALTKMATLRRADLTQDPQYLDLFAAYLGPLDLRAFQVAMAVLSERPREDGEPALPSLGMILAEMDEARELSPNYAAGRKEVLSEPTWGKQALLSDGESKGLLS